MTETKEKIITNRHDSYIKKCLSDPIAMRELLELSFSEDMLQEMDFRTLKIEKTDFIDNELGHNHCDVLLSIQYRKQKSYIYCLVEHQSTVDHFIVTRMLKYMCHIYERHAAQNPRPKKIPLICPLLIYAGKEKYTAAKSIWELSKYPNRAKQFFPLNALNVIDLQKTKDEEIDLKTRPRVGFLFYTMRSIFAKEIYGYIKKAQVAMKLVMKKHRGLKFLGNALCYTMTIADDINKKEKLIELFVDCIPQKDKGKFMTIANQFREEGRQEGRQEGIKQIACNMLASNMNISEISKITKLSPSEVEKLKRKKNCSVKYQKPPCPIELTDLDNTF